MGIISGSGSYRGRFGDHVRVGDHFGVGIISGAVQSNLEKMLETKTWEGEMIDRSRETTEGREEGGVENRVFEERRPERLATAPNLS